MEDPNPIERVLVVPTEAIVAIGAFDGFSEDPRYFAALALASFMDRPAAEADERFRQVIPYLVLRAAEGMFSYARTSRGEERRLHGLRSIGVGGHVNPEDLRVRISELAVRPEASLAAASRRELAEETVGTEGAELRWLGFISDNGSAVARVHFGIVFTAEVDASVARLSDDGAMADAGFAPIERLAADIELYEGWSQLVIGHLG